MNNKIKGLAIILWNFFIVLSIISFLVSLMHIITENITDYWSIIFSTCGCCFLLIIVVWNRFDDLLKGANTFLHDKEKKEDIVTK